MGYNRPPQRGQRHRLMTDWAMCLRQRAHDNWTQSESALPIAFVSAIIYFRPIESTHYLNRDPVAASRTAPSLEHLGRIPAQVTSPSHKGQLKGRHPSFSRPEFASVSGTGSTQAPVVLPIRISGIGCPRTHSCTDGKPSA